jgi:hypothetical protein
MSSDKRARTRAIRTRKAESVESYSRAARTVAPRRGGGLPAVCFTCHTDTPMAAGSSTSVTPRCTGSRRHGPRPMSTGRRRPPWRAGPGWPRTSSAGRTSWTGRTTPAGRSTAGAASRTATTTATATTSSGSSGAGLGRSWWSGRPTCRRRNGWAPRRTGRSSSEPWRWGARRSASSATRPTDPEVVNSSAQVGGDGVGMPDPLIKASPRPSRCPYLETSTVEAGREQVIQSSPS